ncbi:MAG: DUF3617 family protein [Sphingomonadaceae bacterium]|nr:DUF3617 family protein [Sphingomonadaceae bacterium]
MKSLRRIAAASLLITASAALAQDKPLLFEDVPPPLPYDGDEFVAADASVDSAVGTPWPWPDFMQVAPQPGLYRTKLALIAFDMPGNDLLDGFDIGDLIRDQFPEVHEFCVHGDEEPADWLNEVTSGDCGEAQISVDGDRFSATNQCSTPDGLSTSFALDGQVAETRSRIDFRFTSQEEGGAISMHMRATTRRMGDCE